MKALVISSPIGPLRLRAEAGALVAVDFSPFADRTVPADLAEPTNRAEPAELAEPADLAEPGDLAEPADLAEPGDLAEPADLAEPGDLAEPTNRAEPADLADHADPAATDPDDRVLAATAVQLTAYFSGTLTSFDLPLAPRGTAFQQRVWQALRQVGYGETASYSDVARSLGKTSAASRAIGLANGRNPIPIIIPCHRIIGSNGALTGYAGGVERKRRLLELERPSLIPDEI